jgi:hypothetical protein
LILNKFLLRFSFALAALTTIVALSGRTADAQTDHVSLNADIVEGFAASFAVVQSKAEELSGHYDLVAGGSTGAAWRAWIGAGRPETELDATVGLYGFADFKSWVGVLSAIAQAYSFAGDAAAADRQLDETQEKIRNDPNIPAGFKEMMLQQLQHSAAAVATMRPSPENTEAVEPHLDRLELIFDTDG